MEDTYDSDGASKCVYADQPENYWRFLTEKILSILLNKCDDTRSDESEVMLWQFKVKSSIYISASL